MDSILIISKSKFYSKYKLQLKMIDYYTFYNTKENPLKKIQFHFTKKYLTLKDGCSSIDANYQYRFKFPLTSYQFQEEELSLIFESYKGTTISVQYNLYVKAISKRNQFISNKKSVFVKAPGQGINPKFRITLTLNKSENFKADKIS